MTGRIPFGLLTMLTALVCAPIQAQDLMGPPSGNGVQPAGFHAFQEADSPGQYHGIPLGYQRQPVGTPGPKPTTIYEELPDDQGFAYDDSPLGRILTDTFRHSWFRSEYLLWNISAPGHVLLGAQPLGGSVTAVNAFNPLSNYGNPGVQPLTSGVQFARTLQNSLLPGVTPAALDQVPGVAMTPGLDSMSINNLNGFRGTFGMPVPTGAVEISSFVLQSSSDTFNGGNINANVYQGNNTNQNGIGTGFIQTSAIANQSLVIGGGVGANGLPATNGREAQFITQPLLVNGQPQALTAGSLGLDYDVSYKAVLTTFAWGAEANYVADSPDPNSLFQFRPVFGARYFNFRDSLSQFGQYYYQPVAPAPFDPATSIANRSINSAATNNIFGPQLGVRAEAMHSRFLFGVEPKIMLGMNAWQSTLNTSNVLSLTDPAQNLVQKGTTFTPLFDAKFYSNVAVTKNFSAYIAYNYIWAGQVNRSYNDIQYNILNANHSNFNLLRNYSGATLQGLSFGCEFRY